MLNNLTNAQMKINMQNIQDINLIGETFQKTTIHNPINVQFTKLIHFKNSIWKKKKKNQSQTTNHTNKADVEMLSLGKNYSNIIQASTQENQSIKALAIKL